MEIKKLKDLCIGKGEYGIAASAEKYSPQKYRYLRITDISDFGELLDGEKKSISCTGCDQYILSEDEIVFARTGNSTGRAFFYETKYGALVYAGFLIKFHLDKTKVNPKYLKYYTISKTYKQWVANGPTGSTRGNMSEGDFANMPVFLPNRGTQDKIVSIMEPLDEQERLNNSICSDLESMAKLLYDYWFVQFDFPDENGKPYKSSGGKMVWNEELKREIPEGWEVGVFSEISDITMGQSPKGDNYNNRKKGLPLINGAVELAKDGIHINKYTEEYTRTCGTNEWIFCIRATLGNIHLSDACYCLGRGVASAKPINDWLKEYAYFILADMISYFEKSLSGSIIIGMTKEDITDYKIIIPKKDVIKNFHKVVGGMFELNERGEKENENLKELRDFLLPMLMNGQVEVKG